MVYLDNISKRKLRKYNNLFSFDLKGFIEDYNDFYINEYPDLLNYWKQRNGILKKDAIEKFNELNNRIYLIKSSFNKIKKEDDSLDAFEIIQVIDDIKTTLDTIKILPRYLGTSSNNVDVVEEPVVDYLIRQGDTLEIISKKFYNNPDDFDKIVDYNNIRYYEVNDSNWVGKRIKVPLKSLVEQISDEIIDVHSGESILGKDIDNDITLTNNDLDVVTSFSCFKQGVLSLLDSPKGSIPEDLSLGHLLGQINGKNLGKLSFPMIGKELKELLSIEPSIKSSKITNIEIIDDAVYVDFTFESKLDNTFDIDYNLNKIGN